MGDVKFASSSGGSSRARKELVTSMGDEGVTVDDDGVLGGANDSEFGGRRRFMRVAEDKDADADADPKKGAKGDGDAKTTSTGFEAGAMEEGFYQRDVAAEYEALDYDANEQFDDDDVNVGEDEMMDDGGGFGGDYESGDDDMMDSEEDPDSDAEEALRGMASGAGMRAMLARARGDSPANQAGEGGKALGQDGDVGADGKTGEKQVINRMLDAASKTAEEMKKKKAEEKNPSSPAGSGAPLSNVDKAKAAGIEKDKDGKRLITLEAVRREVWLNGGSISSKRLMKKFDVTSKNPDRQQVFKAIVMELCNMKKDVDGSKKLVLKQHYSKI